MKRPSRSMDTTGRCTKTEAKQPSTNCDNPILKFQSDKRTTDKFQRQIAANWKKQIKWTNKDEMNHMDYNGQQ